MSLPVTICIAEPQCSLPLFTIPALSYAHNLVGEFRECGGQRVPHDLKGNHE
uniref:Uncharacterized protein n=1 Tax=Mesocestoides corti TaxID=53468 RepID=A0A5K3EGS1_MESCO